MSDARERAIRSTMRAMLDGAALWEMQEEMGRAIWARCRVRIDCIDQCINEKLGRLYQ